MALKTTKPSRSLATAGKPVYDPLRRQLEDTSHHNDDDIPPKNQMKLFQGPPSFPPPSNKIGDFVTLEQAAASKKNKKSEAPKTTKPAKTTKNTGHVTLVDMGVLKGKYFNVVEFLTSISSEKPISARCMPRGLDDDTPFLPICNSAMKCLSLDTDKESGLYVSPPVTQQNTNGVSAAAFINTLFQYGIPNQSPLHPEEDPDDYMAILTPHGYVLASQLKASAVAPPTPTPAESPEKKNKKRKHHKCSLSEDVFNSMVDTVVERCATEVVVSEESLESITETVLERVKEVIREVSREVFISLLKEREASTLPAPPVPVKENTAASSPETPAAKTNDALLPIEEESEHKDKKAKTEDRRVPPVDEDSDEEKDEN